jgi:hypothetical protein
MYKKLNSATELIQRHQGGSPMQTGPTGPPSSCHSAITKESFGEPKIFPASGEATAWELIWWCPLCLANAKT